MQRILVAGISEINPELFRSEDDKIMSSLNKPHGFLWGSTKLPGSSPYISDWMRFVIEEWDSCIEKYKEGISFTLKRKSKICTIDTEEDYRNLMKKYSKRKYEDMGLNIINTKVIDWEKLSKDYDAFHLTEDAFWSMRLPLHDIVDMDSGERLDNFYSYDCESWIIFNLDCINEGSILNHCCIRKENVYDR